MIGSYEVFFRAIIYGIHRLTLIPHQFLFGNASLQVDDTEVVNFLLQTEIIPLCLRIMETGSELSKTVATFIVQKMLLDEMGLTYVCATAERFYAVCKRT